MEAPPWFAGSGAGLWEEEGDDGLPPPGLWEEEGGNGLVGGDGGSRLVAAVYG